MMLTRNAARRIVPLRRRGERNVPRAKKPVLSCPTADQITQVISRLHTLLATGEAEKVDGELERLLQALGLDPASPAAWRDGFLLLAGIHHGVGRPRRTNENAKRISADHDWVLLHEVIRLKDQGLTQQQAIEKLASDLSKVGPLKLKPESSKAQRVEVLRKRMRAIKKKRVGLKNIWGSPSISTVEEALINRALVDVGKNKPAF